MTDVREKALFLAGKIEKRYIKACVHVLSMCVCVKDMRAPITVLFVVAGVPSECDTLPVGLSVSGSGSQKVPRRDVFFGK